MSQRKWPDGPRFVVGSVQGYKINPQGVARQRQAPGNAPTLWYVNDAAFNYKTLLETWNDQEAWALARRLNA